jgi:hypothetical protein
MLLLPAPLHPKDLRGSRGLTTLLRRRARLQARGQGTTLLPLRVLRRVQDPRCLAMISLPLLDLPCHRDLRLMTLLHHLDLPWLLPPDPGTTSLLLRDHPLSVGKQAVTTLPPLPDHLPATEPRLGRTLPLPPALPRLTT